MSRDQIRGKTYRFIFDDGPMAGKAFEHAFHMDGTVAFRMAATAPSAGVQSKGAAEPKAHTEPQAAESDSGDKPPEAPSTKYEVATIRDDVCAVAYLSSAGYTLTSILDFTSKKLVAFASNEKMLGLQHGSFEEVAGSATRAVADRDGARPHASGR